MVKDAEIVGLREKMPMPKAAKRCAAAAMGLEAHNKTSAWGMEGG